MCHAPVVVPDVAGPRADLVAASTRAMAEAARRVVAGGPDATIIVAPHAPRARRSFVVGADQFVRGDFSLFGAPEVGASVPCAEFAAGEILRQAEAAGLSCQRRELGLADHSTMVPLHFLVTAGWSGPTAVVALPEVPRLAECIAFGQALARAATALDQRWAVVASGDMSHRLQPGAPSGYHDRAHLFDEAVVQQLARHDLSGALSVSDGLRALAAEDVLDSLAVAAGAIGGSAADLELLAYEAPFGVGYLNAVLRDRRGDPVDPDSPAV